MIALAAPLPQPRPQLVSSPRVPSTSSPVTQAQKRRRVEEVEASDVSDHIDTGSPRGEQSAASTSEREMKRARAEDRDSRGGSVVDSGIHPADVTGDLVSSLEMPTRYDTEDTTSHFNEEPEYLGHSTQQESSNGLTNPLERFCEDLKLQFPGHQFGLHGDKINCYECDKLIMSTTDYSVRRHLNSKQHAANWELRKAREDAVSVSRPGTSNIQIAQQRLIPQSAQQSPLARHAVNSNLTLMQARQQYLMMLENETVESISKSTSLSHRIDAVDNKYGEKFEDLKRHINTSVEDSMEEIKTLTTAQDRFDLEMQKVNLGSADIERRVKDRFSAVHEDISKVEMDVKAFKESVSTVKNAIKQTESKMQDFEERTIHKVSNLAGILSKNEVTFNEKFDTFDERVAKLEKHEVKPEKWRTIVEKLTAHRVRAEEVEAKVWQMKDFGSRLRKVEEISESQSERTDGLEMSLQVLSEDLKSSMNERLGSDAKVNELKTHLRKVVERVTALGLEAEERARSTEDILVTRFAQQEKDLGAKIESMQNHHEAQINHLLQLFQAQEEKIHAQDKLLAKQTSQLEQHQDLLQRCAEGLEQQSRVINKLALHIDENNTFLKQQVEDVKVQGKIVQHVKTTMPLFMTDLKIVDDKIEDFIEACAERDSAREVREREQHLKMQEQRKNTAPRKGLGMPLRKALVSGLRKRKVRRVVMPCQKKITRR